MEERSRQLDEAPSGLREDCRPVLILPCFEDMSMKKRGASWEGSETGWIIPQSGNVKPGKSERKGWDLTMRSTDEQLREIMRRREILTEKRSIRRHLHASAIASCICAVLLIAVCFRLPQPAVTPENAALKQYGSLLLAAPYTGCVVVGILAFALGVCVTLLCLHWRSLKQKERKEK